MQNDNALIEIMIERLIPEVASYQVPVVDLINLKKKDPYKILVATILSSRTKDETTTKVAARLFKKAPCLNTLDSLTEKEIRNLIYPIGFYKTKAKHLKELPKTIQQVNEGKIPDELETLLQLPGVGRKTANLVLTEAFDKPAICVDTHVHRIMNIWGYVKTNQPLETEMELRKKLPPQYWKIINTTLVAFGQGTCKPVAPHCDRCVVSSDCPKMGVTPRKIPERNKLENKNKKEKLFISWNVNGIRAIEKKGFIDILKELNADIFTVQETKAHPDQLSDKLKNIEGYYSYWASAEKKGYSGLTTYTKEKPLNVIYGIGVEEFDKEGRVLTLEFPEFFLVNTYFPNAQPELVRIDFKVRFNQTMSEFLNKLKRTKTTILCGDLNVAHKPIDLKNPENNENNPGYSIQERQWMDKFLQGGYTDTFRMFNQEPDQYTWWSYRYNARSKNIGWRIDYFCIDKQSAHKVKHADILKDIMGSDHCPITLLLKME